VFSTYFDSTAIGLYNDVNPIRKKNNTLQFQNSITSLALYVGLFYFWAGVERI